MGRANGLDYVLDAARILKESGKTNIAIVLHGDGGERTRLKERVAVESLDNVTFSDIVPDKAAVAEIVAAVEVCMTIYAKTTLETGWSPNKMFDALAGGRPVLINVPGWLRETIEGNGCGRFVDPQRPESLANEIAGLANDASALAEMGRKARALAEREFARDILAARLEQIFLASIAARRAA